MNASTELRAKGYRVTARKTGAQYPNACPIGLGWAFVLSAPGQPDREFADHRMAWAFAGRLAAQIIPA